MAEAENTVVEAVGRIPVGSTSPGANIVPRGLSYVGAEHRGLVALCALAAGCLFILIGSLVLPIDSFWAIFLFEHTHHSPFPYPFTLQNLTHLIFFVGLGELFVRWQIGRASV